MAEITVIRYEKFFEVRVLHEFYLNTNSKRSYFSLDDASRAAYLDTLLFRNRYDIWNDVTFEPSEETKKTLQNLNLRFVRTKTGFFIGIKVKAPADTDHPFTNPDGNAALTFRMRIKNPYVKNFTNLTLNSALPSTYLFTNGNEEGLKVLPSLSLPVEDFRSDKTYEFGEVARMGNDIMEAVKRTNSFNAGDWRKISAVGIAHEGDRTLLPSRFWYRFEADSDVRQAVFALRTTGGTSIKTVHTDGSTPLRNVLLDFSVDDSSTVVQKGTYLLEVNGDNGYFRQYRVSLNTDHYNSQDLGIIEIRYNTGDAAFGLINPDGSLKVPGPVYEVRLKSRISYWRYRSNSGIKLKTTAKTDPYLTPVDGVLKSIDPAPMNAMPLEFVDENPAIPAIFLPNPPGNALSVENNGDIFSDIYISGIKDLIEEVI